LYATSKIEAPNGEAFFTFKIMTDHKDEPSELEIANLKEKLSEKEDEVSKLRSLVSDQWQAEASATNENEIESEEEEPSDLNLADILANPEVTKAVNTAVEAWAKTQPDAMKLKFRSLHLGIAFSCLVLLVIATLGYLGVLTKEVTGTLLGALLGYWYGRHQSKKD
jgi:hypothetical protein